ncbi:MAG: 4Fe-4S cluster-binding domain-containing protein, partial [Pseudobdellovibrionaceae bacterium]
MRYTSVQITFQEIPDEISLSLLISGCPLRCPGCHSADSWQGTKGEVLDIESLNRLLEKDREYITCICFLGGEWEKENLIHLLQWSRRQGFKTALYTGLEDVDQDLKRELDYLKVGPYMARLGGLGSST